MCERQNIGAIGRLQIEILFVLIPLKTTPWTQRMKSKAQTKNKF